MKELSTFYEEGKMHRLDGLEADPKLKCLKIFQEIGWVGAVKAHQLYDKGMRSVEDLRTKGLHLLSEQAQICLNRCNYVWLGSTDENLHEKIGSSTCGQWTCGRGSKCRVPRKGAGEGPSERGFSIR